MPRNRRKHGCPPRRGRARIGPPVDRRAVHVSVDEEFTALELDFFRRGEEWMLESAGDCSVPRTIWSEATG
jgi:hypothetical protein